LLVLDDVFILYFEKKNKKHLHPSKHLFPRSPEQKTGHGKSARWGREFGD